MWGARGKECLVNDCGYGRAALTQFSGLLPPSGISLVVTAEINDTTGKANRCWWVAFSQSDLTGIYSVPLLKPPNSADLTLSNKRAN